MSILHGIYRVKLYRGCLRDISLNKKITDDELKEQHLIDAKKTLEHLKTARNNTNKTEKEWQGFVKARIEYMESFIEYLKKGTKEIAHFK